MQHKSITSVFLVLLSLSIQISSSAQTNYQKKGFYQTLCENLDNFLNPPFAIKSASEKLYFSPPVVGQAEFSLRVFENDDIFYIDGTFFKSNYTDDMFKSAREKKSLDFAPTIERRMCIVSLEFYESLYNFSKKLKGYKHTPPVCNPGEIVLDDTQTYQVRFNGKNNEYNIFSASKNNTNTYETYLLFLRIANDLRDGSFSEDKILIQISKASSLNE